MSDGAETVRCRKPNRIALRRIVRTVRRRYVANGGTGRHRDGRRCWPSNTGRSDAALGAVVASSAHGDEPGARALKTVALQIAHEPVWAADVVHRIARVGPRRDVVARGRDRVRRGDRRRATDTVAAIRVVPTEPSARTPIDSAGGLDAYEPRAATVVDRTAGVAKPLRPGGRYAGCLSVHDRAPPALAPCLTGGITSLPRQRLSGADWDQGATGISRSGFTGHAVGVTGVRASGIRGPPLQNRRIDAGKQAGQTKQTDEAA